MKPIITALSLSLFALFTTHSHANDSTGYIGTGSIEYLKNDKIAMASENLYISKDIIKVDYQFKNLSNKDVSETVVFPLPKVGVNLYSDFADTEGLIDSFKIQVNQKSIKPSVHVRTFMYPLKIVDGYEQVDYDAKAIDVTQAFKSCGISDKQMMSPWANLDDIDTIHTKLIACNHPTLNPLIGKVMGDDISEAMYWESQIVYSWQQTFKANSTTAISHSYKPLVGGSVHLDKSQYDDFCMDSTLTKSFGKDSYQPYSALEYILTTGANWAKPIGKFTLTIERDDDEIVSLCWKNQGQLKKIGANTFQVSTQNFTPKHDLHIAFIQNYTSE